MLVLTSGFLHAFAIVQGGTVPVTEASVAWAVAVLLGASLALNGFFLMRVAKSVSETSKALTELELSHAVLKREVEIWTEALRDDFGPRRRSGDPRHEDDPPSSHIHITREKRTP